jgi:hypothetical protein
MQKARLTKIRAIYYFYKNASQGPEARGGPERRTSVEGEATQEGSGGT